MGEVKARGLLCTWDFPAAGLALTLPLLLRTSRKTTKESLAQTSSSITESLMGISRVMSQQVQQSEEAMQTLGNVGGSRTLPPGGAAAEPLARTCPRPLRLCLLRSFLTCVVSHFCGVWFSPERDSAALAAPRFLQLRTPIGRFPHSRTPRGLWAK